MLYQMVKIKIPIVGIFDLCIFVLIVYMGCGVAVLLPNFFAAARIDWFFFAV